MALTRSALYTASPSQIAAKVARSRGLQIDEEATRKLIEGAKYLQEGHHRQRPKPAPRRANSSRGTAVTGSGQHEQQVGRRESGCRYRSALRRHRRSRPAIEAPAASCTHGFEKQAARRVQRQLFHQAIDAECSRQQQRDPGRSVARVASMATPTPASAMANPPQRPHAFMQDHDTQGDAEQGSTKQPRAVS